MIATIVLALIVGSLLLMAVVFGIAGILNN